MRYGIFGTGAQGGPFFGPYPLSRQLWKGIGAGEPFAHLPGLGGRPKPDVGVVVRRKALLRGPDSANAARDSGFLCVDDDFDPRGSGDRNSNLDRLPFGSQEWCSGRGCYLLITGAVTNLDWKHLLT